MKKTIVKSFVCCMILLFCVSNLHAQYKVFKVKGTVEVSEDGETWNPLKKKDELKESDQIRMLENSLIDIIDTNNLIYSYTGTNPISVKDIVKKNKAILDAMNENSGMRKAFGGTVRSDGNAVLEADKGVYALFIDMETFHQYDHSDAIPEGTIFFITICNTTDEDKMVNVFQNEELKPYFPQDISVEKNTIVEIPDVLFGKFENNDKFVIHCSK